MSETSRHYCLLNSAISRNKGELHALESSDIWIFFAQKKITYTNTHLRSQVTLYTFYKKLIRKQTFLFIFCYIVYNE